jgi:hypothetical protein
MRNRLHTLVALALLVSLLFAVVLPAVSSSATALRAKRFSNVLFWAIAAWGAIAVCLAPMAGLKRFFLEMRLASTRSLDLIALTSARLC